MGISGDEGSVFELEIKEELFAKREKIIDKIMKRKIIQRMKLSK